MHGFYFELLFAVVEASYMHGFYFELLFAVVEPPSSRHSRPVLNH